MVTSRVICAFLGRMTFCEIQPGTPEHEAALRLREAVLRRPLGLALSAAELADEPSCVHLGGFEGGRLFAVLLLQALDGRTVKMRQVAVAAEFQGRGIGAELVAFAEKVARGRGYTRLVAHARESAVGFYGKVGYTVSGESFLETTIPHRLVSKTLG